MIGATTRFHGKRLKIFDSELVPDSAGGSPGEVAGISSKGFTVSAKGGAILVKRVQPEGMPKIASADFIGQAQLKASDRLGE